MYRKNSFLFYMRPSISSNKRSKHLRKYKADHAGKSMDKSKRRYEEEHTFRKYHPRDLVSFSLDK